MASKKYEEWLKGQKHKPSDKITPFQRATSRYLPPKGVTTWGEWYEQTGITPTAIAEKPADKPAAQTGSSAKPEKTPKTASEIKKAIADLKEDISYDQYLLGQIETRKGLNSPEYKKKADQIAAAKSKIKELTPALKEAEKEKTKVTDQTSLEKAEDDLKRAKASGDKQAIQDATNAFAKARNAAIKAGVVGPDGRLPGALAPGGKIGTPLTPTATTGTGPTGGTGSASTGGVKGGGGTGGSGKGTGSGNKGVTAPTDEEQKATALDTAATNFDLPETIFNNVPSLKRLLERYVKEDWTPEKLRKEIRDDNWFRKNSAEIKNRYVQLFNYQDLVKTGQANGSTDYEKQISTLERKLADKARQMGSGLASDPVALRKAAENMYITNVGIDDAMTTDFIAAAIRPITSTLGGKTTEGYSGQALKDYQDLQAVAKANGFKISDILPGKTTEQQVLQGLATGSIDANRLAQDARKLAAQGQPQYVRDLLGQGYNLDQVFAPYRNTMASILEIDDPNSIDLNDPTLRSAISDKGDMNVYDFKKLLKADNRWQYTENAKKDVADSALTVLRDFGFQG